MQAFESMLLVLYSLTKNLQSSNQVVALWHGPRPLCSAGSTESGLVGVERESSNIVPNFKKSLRVLMPQSASLAQVGFLDPGGVTIAK